MKWTVALDGGPKRVNHAACAVGDTVYCIGGYCSEEYNKKRPIDVHTLDTVQYSGSDCSHQQSSESPQSKRDIPYQRYGHTVVEYKGAIYLFGGRNDSDGSTNILHKFDPVERVWSMIDAGGHKPGARDGHSACVIGDNMIIFGGFEEEFQRFCQETYAYNFITNTWNYVHTQGSPPAWRDFHSATAIGQRMYIFGGRSDELGQYHSSQELYYEKLKYLSLEDMTWHEAEVRNDVKPCGRRSHSTWCYNGRLYLFGGYSGTLKKHYNDLYCYDPKTCEWRQLSVRGNVPTPRRRQCAVMVNDKLYVFGGTCPSSNHDGDGLQSPSSAVFTFEENDAVVVPSWSPHERQLIDLGDLYILDFNPSLLTLCIGSLIGGKSALSPSFMGSLPADIRCEIAARTTSNRMGARRMDTCG